MSGAARACGTRDAVKRNTSDWTIVVGELLVVLLLCAAVVIVSTRSNAETRELARDTAATNRKVAETRARDQRDNSYAGCLRGTRINARSALFARAAQFARTKSYERDGKTEDMQAARVYAEIGSSAERDAGKLPPVAVPDEDLPTLAEVLRETEPARVKFCLDAYPPL